MEKPYSLKPITFEKDSIIFEEGAQSDAAYLITDGRVEIRIGVHGNNPQVLATRGKNDVIGEMSFFDDQPRMATAIAIKKTKVLAMSSQEFQKKVDELSPFMKGVVCLMVKRMRHMAKDLMERKDEVNWANWRKEK